VTVAPSDSSHFRRAAQLERDKAQLRRQLDERTTELTAAQSQALGAVGWADCLVRFNAQLTQSKAQLKQELNGTREAHAKATVEVVEQARRTLEDVQQRLAKEVELRQTAQADAEQARQTLQSQTQVIQQLERDNEQQGEADAQLAQDKAQLEQENVQLQQQLDERTAALAASQSQRAVAAGQTERIIIAVKQEKMDAIADAHGAAQQAAKAVAGKRKADEELENEAKRRRAAEAARDEFSERNKQLQSALLVNPAARPDCSSCFEHPTSAVCLPCGHLVSCIECAEQWQSKNRTCPVCRLKVTKVVQTYLASGSD